MTSETGNQPGQQTQPPEAVAGGLIRLALVFIPLTVLVFLGSMAIWDMTTAWVALLSSAICFLGATLGHLCSIFPRGDVFRLARLYQSMAVRIALPVILLFACKKLYPELFSRGMVYFVFLFYVVGLLMEVIGQASKLKVLTSGSESVLNSASKGESQAG